MVSAQPRAQVHGDVEVAVVLPAPGGTFLHRRVVGSSRVLAAVMPEVLFEPEPDPALLRARAPSRVRTVRDLTFGTFQEALESAHCGDPPVGLLGPAVVT